MTLYDYLTLCDGLSVDVTDSEYDIILSFDSDCITGENRKNYDFFVSELAKKGTIKKFFNGAYASVMVDFCSFVENHIPELENLFELIPEPDEPVYERCYDIFHCFETALNGNYSMTSYKKMIEGLKKIK